jgi:hypothetical protein
MSLILPCCESLGGGDVVVRALAGYVVVRDCLRSAERGSARRASSSLALTFVSMCVLFFGVCILCLYILACAYIYVHNFYFHSICHSASTTYIQMHTSPHAHIHVHTYIHMHICWHAQIHTYARILSVYQQLA